ncbi:DUF1611 domain-containing protein [Flagellimonas meridianipacifica]|uniref:Putative NAD-dependent epimerase/dehydratase family protein n=1 Tax=Flagellimonas meridianipacifica TaxID=1080225 RepID=A0A2T0MBC6_9FLAO|nr:DUF1611 domain-containing protein [Allomuricauda pacifica]PRX54799.1 putative NAD-dependent epimerase/dehydratase family protein [Allomuricauda pacifica]
MFNPQKKLCIYMEGALDNDSGKMGFGLMRFSKNPIVCVIDSKFQGKTVQEAVNLPYQISVVGTVKEAISKGSEVMVLGIAPSGGKFPDSWDEPVSFALKNGLSLINGLHDDLNARFHHLLNGNRIWDVRKPKPSYPIATGKAANLNNKRILMIGTDMASGKMTAGLELYASLLKKEVNVGFVPTGQIGITLMGSGIPLDAIKVDQAAGAVEEAVLAESDKEIVIVEGQGSLAHPGSTATLPLMRGAQPTHFILCHKAANNHLRFPVSHIPIPPLDEFVKLNESVAKVCGSQNTANTLGIALNTIGLSDEEANKKIIQVEELTGLPTTDVVRFGVEKLINTILH